MKNILLSIIVILIPKIANAQNPPQCLTPGQVPTSSCVKQLIGFSLQFNQPDLFKEWANKWLQETDQSAESALIVFKIAQEYVNKDLSKVNEFSQVKEQLRSKFRIAQANFDKLANIAEAAEVTAKKNPTDENKSQYIKTHNVVVRAYDKLKEVARDFVNSNEVLQAYLNSYISSQSAANAAGAAFLLAQKTPVDDVKRKENPFDEPEYIDGVNSI